MAYPVLADFRSGTLAAYCQGLALDTTEAPDALLTATLAGMVTRFEALTNDRFVSASATYDLSGDGSSMLDLPQRCTAITTVKTLDLNGTLTTQAATVYRLVSSLNAAGSVRNTPDAMDYLQVVPGQYLSLVTYGSATRWPTDPKAVQVVGTFGWTVTPFDASRAVALITFDAIKTQAQQLRRATTLETADARYTYDSEDTEHPTGVTEADDIIRNYRRSSGLLVG